MNEEQDVSATVSDVAYNSPGRAIRQAREKAGISVDELGSRTRLSRATLEAMERDAFDQLLEPVYVRGYYRKCARVLEIPEDPLIAAYESVYTPPPKVVPARLRLAPSGDLNASPRFGTRFVVIAPVLAVVVIAVIWLIRQAPSQTPLSQSVTLIDPENPNIILTDAMPPIDDVVVSDEANSANDFSSTVDASTASVAASNEPAQPAPTEPAPVGTALQLEFTALSWARIEDSSGKSLLSGVISAGESRTLEGKPPYSVFLGNAPGVKVKFGGLDIDIAPHTKANSTARFSVPAAGG